MASSEIPVRPSLAEQELQIQIEGRQYTLAFHWIGREEKWYLDVLDDVGASVYLQIAIVLNFPLGVRCVDARFWPGLLMAVDTGGGNLEPGLADLGDRVRLVYFDAASLPLDMGAA